MSNVNLGPSGSMTTLAHTLTESLPTEVGKKVDAISMSDGSVRYAMYLGQRRWQLTWPKLTAAQLATLVTMRAYNQALTYQNNDESATIYNVAVTSLSYDVINPVATVKFYSATMTLEEVV